MNDDLNEALSGAQSLLDMFARWQSEALDLFDRCLAENNPAPITAYIERQLLPDPAHLSLLKFFSDGLHQRQLSLRAYRYDIRHQAVKAFEDYGVDITPLAPANAAERYYLLDARAVMKQLRESANLDEADVLMLSKMLEASLRVTARLHKQLTLIDNLQALINDWVVGLNATVARRFWSGDDDTVNTTVQ